MTTLSPSLRKGKKMGNTKLIAYFPNEEEKLKFIKRSIECSSEIIEHYNFVIDDISSEIANPNLQKTKEPTLEFLKSMREEWKNHRKQLEKNLDDLTR